MSKGNSTTLEVHPSEKQYEAWNAVAPDNESDSFVLFGGGANGGKSWLGNEWLLSMALTYPKTRWLMARNELKKLKQTTLVTFFKVCAHHKIKRNFHYKYTDNHSIIKFSNGSEIIMMDLKYKPSDPDFDELGSLELTGAFVDEVAEIVFMAFDVLKSRVGRHNNTKYGITPKILMSCNPTKGWVYKYFYKPWKEGKELPQHKFIQSLVGDNPYREVGSRKQLELISNKATKERLLYGNWEFDDDPTKLTEYERLLDMFTNKFVKRNAKRYITADIATYGSDSYVLFVWDGFVLIDWEIHELIEPNEIEANIKKLAEKFHVPRSHIAYDAGGSGIFLRGYLKGAVPVVNNGKPRQDTKKPDQQEQYANIKSQLGFKAAERINKNGYYLPYLTDKLQEQLTEELEAALKNGFPDRDGKLELIRKDKVKLLLGRSPDLFDAFILREVFELPTGNAKIMSFGIK